MSQTAAQRQWYLRNREYKLAQNKKWRDGHKKRLAALTSRWYKANRKRHCAQTSAARRLRKSKNPEKFYALENKRAEAWRIKNRKHWRDLARRWKAKNPRRVKELLRRHLYGIEPEDFNQLLAKQKNRCSICRDSFSKQTPNVDHCHNTKKIRGLLCRRCNQGLGFFRDSKKFLRRAIRYL